VLRGGLHTGCYYFCFGLEDKSWQLEKFDGGRYHIERLVESSKKEVICDLRDGSVVITKIFHDSINGGVFYSANVTCNDQAFDAPSKSLTFFALE
jgi:hypothetical protein